MLNDKDYMPLMEAASALGVSRQVLYKRLKNGSAPAHIRLGDRTFFERADVERHAEINPARGGDR